MRPLSNFLPLRLFFRTAGLFLLAAFVRSGGSLPGMNAALAQSATTTLKATVVDESGALLPGAIVAAEDAPGGQRRQAVTGGEGQFVIPLLPPAVKRPDLVAGPPLYLADPSAAGGRRINRNAFAAPPPDQQGSLGRHSLRGFFFSQVDLSLRRGIALTEGHSLPLRADLFNVFSHPNFADPGNHLESPTCGESVQMLGRGSGRGGAEADFSPLYQVGGPRSAQLAVRLSF